MLDWFLKQCTYDKLNAAQNFATLATGLGISQAIDPSVADENFLGIFMVCLGTSRLLCTISDAAEANKKLGRANPYTVSPFSIQASSSAFIAAITFVFREKTPINISFAIGSAVISAVSLYNMSYHDEGSSLYL